MSILQSAQRINAQQTTDWEVQPVDCHIDQRPNANNLRIAHHPRADHCPCHSSNRYAVASKSDNGTRVAYRQQSKRYSPISLLSA
jgi:hypothetical protein